MDILIKNMELPKSCIDADTSHGCFCLLHCKVGREMVKKGKSLDGRPKDCPLVALPSHGRLGDLDEISDKLLGKGLTRFFVREKRYLTIGDARKIIENAPVIVEASNGTDN